MYGIYDDIVQAAIKATAGIDEAEQLLEYPEVQADKAYYLSVLADFNKLRQIRDKLASLTAALDGEKELETLIVEAPDGEKSAVYEEISALRRTASRLGAELAEALNCGKVNERAYCRFKLSAMSAKLGEQLFALLKQYLPACGVSVDGEAVRRSKEGFTSEISFFAEGNGALGRLSPLSGAHKVYVPSAKSEELCFAVTPCAKTPQISQKDIKIDLFHSSGAGGQNVNKVETAVRATHIPTGTAVVCQDERSQLKNKQRAVETLQKRLRESAEAAEKKRMEADIFAQYSAKNTPISFDLANSTMTDARLTGFCKVAFPPDDFASYMNRLMTI